MNLSELIHFLEELAYWLGVVIGVMFLSVFVIASIFILMK